MKKLIVANWKCFKTVDEGLDWTCKVGENLPELNDCEVVVCPSFVSLEPVSRLVKEKGYGFKVGAQSVSSYESGAYTGEVSAKMLEGLVSYALLGHSERRSNFGETNKDMETRVSLCRNSSIEPILLIRGEEDVIPEAVSYYAWEPVNAIGTGKAIDATSAADMVCNLANGRKDLYGMYGGSVTALNVKSYVQSPDLYGVVVGSASLDPNQFLEMLNALR